MGFATEPLFAREQEIVPVLVAPSENKLFVVAVLRSVCLFLVLLVSAREPVPSQSEYSSKSFKKSVSWL